MWTGTDERRAAWLIALAIAGGCDVDARPLPAPGLPDDEPFASSGGFDSDGSSVGLEPSSESSSGGEASLNAYLYGLGHLAIDDFQAKTETNCSSNCSSSGEEGELWCAYVHYSETRHEADFVALDYDSQDLWVGNVVRGASALEGQLIPIALPRAPIVLSTAAHNLEGSPVRVLEDPRLSGYREVHKDFADHLLTGGKTAVAYSEERVHSLSQVSVEVGTSAGFVLGSVSNMFDFSNYEESTKILVQFSQEYYSIEADAVPTPQDFFTDDVTPADFAPHVEEDGPPMYIQSIAYGRKVLFSLESQATEYDVRSALQASLGLFGAGAETEVTEHHRNVLDSSRIKAVILGGNPDDAVKVVTGFDGLVEYIQEGAEYSADSPGEPIAYKLSYLDNVDALSAISGSYQERQCHDRFVDVRAVLATLDYLGGNDPGVIQVTGSVQLRVSPPLEPDPCRDDAPGWTTIWERGGGGIDVPGFWVNNQPAIHTVLDYELDPLQNDYICLRASLVERDAGWFNSDDPLGNSTLGPIPASQWAGDHYFEVSDQGTVGLTVRLSLD